VAAPARATIVAVASPPGRGVRALVRASGPGVRAAARAVLGIEPAARGVLRARARLDGFGCSGVGLDAADIARAGMSCPVIALWMESGASFTGEDALEISCVGAPALASLVAEALVAGAQGAGFEARLARRGEFAFRAHLAGRLSVDEAEAIAARIAATSDAEIAAADELAGGATGTRAAELLAGTAELLALVEAGIDFTDQEDVVAIAPAVLAARAAGLADACAALRGAQASAHAHAVPLVVLAGAPNAGKSTLFNALLGRPRTIASDFAGTTRDAIVERLLLGAGLEADLADLAGLERVGHGEQGASVDRDATHTTVAGASTRAGVSTHAVVSTSPGSTIAADMQRRAHEMLAAADVIVRCTPCGAVPVAITGIGPASRDPGGAPQPDLVEVATMSDLGAAARAGAHARTLSVSARTGDGIDALKAELAARIRRDRALRRARLADILPRHDAAFAAAESALRETAVRAGAAIVRPDDSAPRLGDVELVASLLRAALDALGEVAGPMHPDEVLGLVFSRFCIGK
jgi:tRNA modification GTPase